MSERTGKVIGETRTAFIHELTDAKQKIEHCLAQLDDNQIWWRPSAEMNSVANLALHLCGNVRQWIMAGVGGEADNRDRPAEFAARSSAKKSELLTQLDEVVSQACEVVRQVSVDELVRQRRIQGFEATGVGAILHSISHFRGHTQEIVHMTRIQLGPKYQFDFQPTTPEQGSLE